MSGRRKDGIKTLEHIKLRCFVDHESGCWIWGGGLKRGSPVMRAPNLPCSVRRTAWVLSGRDLSDHEVVFSKFDKHDCRCVNPKHMQTGTRKDLISDAVQRGAMDTAARRAVLRRGNLTQAAPVETVRQIEMHLAAGMSKAAIARAVGRHADMVRLVANGRHIHQRGPVLRGASVFSLGG